MADVTLSYKGDDILELSDSGSATLKTGGTYCEADIEVEYVKPSGGGDPYEMLLAVNNNTATNITLGDTTAVKAHMFYGCSNLTSFDFSKITSIGIEALRGAGLTGNIVIPNKITYLGYGSFRATPMQTITFKNLIPRLDKSTFENCNLLESIDLISMSFDIAYTAINNTPSLKNLIIRGNYLIPLSGNLANNCGLKANSDARVYVPSSLVSSYQSATNWSTIADKITAIEGSYYETHYADGTVIS